MALLPDFADRLAELAEVLVRVGVNLQPGQPLLITEPYEQQGVARSAEVLVDAVQQEAAKTGSSVEVQWCDPSGLRQEVETGDREAFARRSRAVVRRAERHIARGGALLFLTGSQPRLFAGLPAERVAEFDRIKWEILGPLVQRLSRGVAQWTLAPAPSPTWAALTFADLPSEERLAALWQAVFAALRVEGCGSALASWRRHLAELAALATDLNARRLRQVRYDGPGTDLSVQLPRAHRWVTAQLRTRAGVDYVANLPTEEVFTAPLRGRADGTIRVARAVPSMGEMLEGVALEFRGGRVVRASAERGGDLLERLLATDDGAAHLGEVAALRSDLGGAAAAWTQARTVFHHPLLDENAANHVALGEAYPFCHTGWWKFGLNRSAIHLDLPLAARVTFR